MYIYNNIKQGTDTTKEKACCKYILFPDPEHTISRNTNLNLCKGDITMTEISILDLQNLRHLIGGYSTTHCKMTDYAAQATDPQVKQLFQEAADSALQKQTGSDEIFIRGI